jgi:hypothetical protein
MKILAFLQNAWVREPDRVQKIYSDFPEQRSSITAKLLFAGGKTGRVLRHAFGPEYCSAIIWEEASTYISGNSKEVVPADLVHIRKVIKQHQPRLIIGFGNIARDALIIINPRCGCLFAPHPAARQPDTFRRLVNIANLAKNLCPLDPKLPGRLV